MFLTQLIKDSRRGEKKRTPPSNAELFDERPDERTLPYFSIVLEQVLADRRYMQLSCSEQGLFWLLVTHVLWKSNGRCIRHPGVIAKQIGIDCDTWQEFEKRLIDLGLLNISEDEYHLIQLELRTQYLMTLEANNNRRRKA